MTEKTLLSERVRPDVEAAPWVIEEIKTLEHTRTFEETISHEALNVFLGRSDISSTVDLIGFVYRMPNMRVRLRMECALKQLTDEANK